MFTTDSDYGWHATPSPTGTVHFDGREVTLSERGMASLAGRLAAGEEPQTAIRDVLYTDRDFGHEIVGFWHWTGRKNPWRMVGRLQICRTIEYGKVHYTATSMITDSGSTTLHHLLGRLARLQHGAAARDRRDRKNNKGRRRERVMSDGEVWSRRAEEGWGPGGY